MTNSRIETFEGKDGQFYNRLVAANNETLMVSEGFPDRSTARDNIAAVRSTGIQPLEDTEDDQDTADDEKQDA